jgi:shikimate kinase
MTPRVVVVGMPGAGKTTTGRRLAKILGLPFADSDDLVEASTGRPVVALFAERGEAAFRAAEHDAISRALDRFDGVLALGGGALTSDVTRAAVAGCGAPVVLLRAELATLGERVGATAGSVRPLLAGDPAARLAALAADRLPLYEDVATLTVGTDDRTPSQVAATIAARLHAIGLA